MKKLICALVLLAMLVPVAAMAAVPTVTAPEEKIDLLNTKDVTGKIAFRGDGVGQYFTCNNGNVTAAYYMTGVLRDYEILYTSDTDKKGVSIIYTPDGNVQDILRKHDGPEIMWNRASEYWFYTDDENAEEIEGRNYSTPEDVGAIQNDEVKNPVTTKYPVPSLNAIPPESIEEILNEYGIDSLDGLKNAVNIPIANPELESFIIENDTLTVTFKEAIAEGVDVLINGRPAEPDDNDRQTYSRETKRKWDEELDVNRPANAEWSANSVQLESIAFVKGDTITVQYYRSDRTLKNTKTSVGALYYTSDNKKIHFQGGELDNKLQLHATYYANSGEREVYFVNGENYNTQTAYDSYNRMVSHEYWDSAFRFWLYEKTPNGSFEWWNSPSGGKEAMNNDLAPTLEVLESLVATEAVALYSIGTSGSDAGLPSILDSGSLVGSTSVSVTNDIIDEHETKYDIAPKSASGESVQPDTPVKMYLPLPAGMDASVASTYDIVVLHDLDDNDPDKKEAFSVDTETMKITDQGLLMMATSYSPYRVIWGAEAEEAIKEYPAAQVKITGESTVNAGLPSTGDSSNLLAYACLLLASAAALVMLSKRRAHQ